MATGYRTQIVYKVIHARLRTDPSAFWRNGELIIAVQPEEISAVGLTHDEQVECQQLANTKQKTVDSVILQKKLNKAGAKKFSELKAQKRLPRWPGARSANSEETEIVTPAPSAARSLFSGIAGAAKRTLLGSTEPEVIPEKSPDVLIESYDSADDSEAVETEVSSEDSIEHTEESLDNEQLGEENLENDNHQEDQPQGEDPVVEDNVSEEDEQAFQKFLRTRWVVHPISPRRLPATTVQKAATVQEALDFQDSQGIFDKDLQILHWIAEERPPWKKLGPAQLPELVKRLFNNHIKEEKPQRRIVLVKAELEEAVRRTRNHQRAKHTWKSVVYWTLTAKLRVAYEYHLITDRQETFYAEVYLDVLKSIESDIASEEEEKKKQQEERYRLNMATIPIATLQMLKMAKEDIDEIEARIANNATAPMDNNDVVHCKATLTSAHGELRTGFNSVYGIAGLLDATVKDHQAQQDEYHKKVKDINLQLIKISSKLPPVPTAGSTNRNSGIKFGTLKIPEFGGKWKEWISFKDIVKTALLDKTEEEMASVHKFQLLRQSLRDDALGLIQSIPVSGANLDRAWQTLCDRYDDTQKLQQDYIQDLDKIKPMKFSSASQLRSNLEKITDNREALRSLGSEVDHWDEILVTKLANSFDYETRSYYEMTIGMTARLTKAKVTWDQIRNFAHQRCLALDSATHPPREERRPDDRQLVPFRRATAMYAGSSNNGARPPLNCYICSEPHVLRKCSKFKNMTVEKRGELVREKKLCVICFSNKHESSNCQSQYPCSVCKRRHNTLLHFGKKPADSRQPRESRVQAHHAIKDFSPVILPTVQVLVTNIAKELMPIRALLDTGSQASFVSERAVQLLKLKRHRAAVEITGIGNSEAGYSRGYVRLLLHSAADSTSQLEITALILPEVTGDTPGRKFSTNHWAHLQGLQLADPHYGKGGKIDVILGADVAFMCLTGGRIQGKTNEPVAHSTCFGWVVGGPGQAITSVSRTSANVATTDISIDVLQQFWGAQGPYKGPLDPWENDNDRQIEEQFKATTKRCEDGKLEVSFPFKTDPPDVGSSREIALKRLAGTEARLARDLDLRQQYEDFMNDYEQQGHMVEVKTASPQDVYLPHHPIIRKTALTTKLRVVFDASAKTSNGLSLNDNQHVGLVIQDDLFSLLTRFRLHKVAINGDITAMYRQIWINPEQQKYQKILWRRRAEDPITEFQLRTVTYGTASAPWLATRALKWIADNEKEKHPEVARIIAEDLYMDDLLSGGDTPEEAHRLQQDITRILLEYGLPLRKWASNDEFVIKAIRGDQDLLTNPEEVVKTLGLKWNQKTDSFQFKVKIKEGITLTKRAMISEIACTFDPLGFAAPVMIMAKILYQEVWQAKIDWDEMVPENIARKYHALREKLSRLEAIEMPRWLGTLKTDTIELHVFSDASEKAYAAAIYLRVFGSSGVACNLVASKTRVAPLQTVSLPRLELMGAVLATELMDQVEKAFRRPVEKKYFWTDSTITLAWIKGAPSRFKTFVANRVSAIQELSDPEDWRHVGTKENPADLVSRGIMPDALKDPVLEFWCTGPWWLREGGLPKETVVPEAADELKKITALAAMPRENHFVKFMESQSSYNRLWRVTAWMLRFYNNLKTKEKQLEPYFTPAEKQRAMNKLIMVVQQQHYPREIKALTQVRISGSDRDILEEIRTSPIRNLTPIIDNEGILRVGGRLELASKDYVAKHPPILPYGHLAKIFMRDLHMKTMHAGPTLLLATARQQFWGIRGPQLAREAVKGCLDCTRWKGETLYQQMGNLPRARTEGLRAFNIVGVDYAGPILVKNRKGRGASTAKTWISVFVCFATKAIHLELVSELTSEAFIAALRRFIARRGLPREIHSDNGTNFVGANKELQVLLMEQNAQQEIAQASLQEGIMWKFIPPSAPHQGGLWESAVKSVKHHLRRVLGEAMLTFEELTTVLCQIEAQLNSRPLCPLSEDPSELDFLTPGHFLIGQPLTAAPDPSLAHIKENRLSRWQYLQRLQQSYWDKWNDEYLSSLQQRKKWQHPQEDLKLDALVLIKEDNTAPNQWRRGRVIALHPGKDGKTRVVTLRTAQGEVKRPIVKLIRLI